MLLAAVLLLTQTQVSVVVGGDAIPHVSVKRAAASHAVEAVVDGDAVDVSHAGWSHSIGPLAASFRAADIAVVNLETPICRERRFNGSMTFNAPDDMVRALKAAGVSVLITANNHALDQGPAGITSTLEAAHELGLSVVGTGDTLDSAWTPLIKDVRGTRVAFIAATRFLNQHENACAAQCVAEIPYSNPAAERALINLVAQTRAMAEVVLVSMHWGEEYVDQPLNADRLLARRLIRAGASAVIGHHPHVVQPVEWVSRRDGSRGLVAYSLGNLISNQGAGNSRVPMRAGLMLQMQFVPMADAPARVGLVTAIPVWTTNRGGATEQPSIQAVVLSDELSELRGRIEALTDRANASDAAERKRLLGRWRMLRERYLFVMGYVPKEVRASNANGVQGSYAFVRHR